VGLEDDALTIMVLVNSLQTRPDVAARFEAAMKRIAADPAWVARTTAILEACAAAEPPPVRMCDRRARALIRSPGPRPPCIRALRACSSFHATRLHDAPAHPNHRPYLATMRPITAHPPTQTTHPPTQTTHPLTQPPAPTPPHPTPTPRDQTMRHLRKEVHWVGLVDRKVLFEGCGANSRLMNDPIVVQALQVGGSGVMLGTGSLARRLGGRTHSFAIYSGGLTRGGPREAWLHS
jgi:hypothetical protein